MMATLARRLSGRGAAVSLALLAMMAGAATYVFLTGLVPIQTKLPTRRN